MSQISARFIVPFRSGIHLNTQVLLHGGYGPLVDALAAPSLPAPHAWRAVVPAADVDALVFGADDRDGSPFIPRWSIETTLEPPSSIAGEIAVAGGILAIQELSIVVFDFGVGVAVARFEGELDDAADVAATVRSVELASDRFAEKLAAFLPTPMASLREVLSRNPHTNEILIDGVDAAHRREAVDASRDAVKLLWVHRLVGLPGREGAVVSLTAVASLATGSAVELRDADEGQILVPGTGTSVSLSTMPLPPDSAAAIPSSIETALILLNAYWAGFSQYDQAIFSGISALHVVRRSGQSKQIRAQAEIVLELQERILLFSAIVEHQGNHLSPDAQLVWDAVRRVWNLQPLFDGMMANVGTLDGLFRHVAETVRSDQADRLNRVVTVLTVASISTVGVDLLALISADPASAAAPLRVGALVVPLLVLLAAWLIARNEALVRRRSGND